MPREETAATAEAPVEAIEGEEEKPSTEEDPSTEAMEAPGARCILCNAHKESALLATSLGF
jgi:hypothetical protein